MLPYYVRTQPIEKRWCILITHESICGSERYYKLPFCSYEMEAMETLSLEFMATCSLGRCLTVHMYIASYIFVHTVT